VGIWGAVGGLVSATAVHATPALSTSRFSEKTKLASYLSEKWKLASCLSE
jgi:hypothetical protein